MRKRFIQNIIILSILLLSIFLISGCADDALMPIDKSLTVTLLNGEHYEVVGENKKTVEFGDSVEFEIAIERGFMVIGAYGDKCDISNNVSFNKTVSFSDIKYKSVVRLETEEMSTQEFSVEIKDNTSGFAEINAILGAAEENVYFSEDIIDVNAVENEGFRFVCWSIGNYLIDGGEFYSYEKTLLNFDFNSINKLYANYRDLSSTGNLILYEMDNGVEIEQDCSVMLENHPRANTLTAVDMRAHGIDCDSRMLVGWRSDNQDYIGLGSRVAVSDKYATVLFPIWKEYTDTDYFNINQWGGVCLLDNISLNNINEIVIPNKINGVKVTSIIAGAFTNCSASVYYLPDTINTVEDNAFEDCSNLTELYMSDNVMTITDNAFRGCANFTTLHINAFLRPRHTKDDVILKTDIYDRLVRSREESIQRVVILGGSSVKNGYSVSEAENVFAEKLCIESDIYNMGWSALYCGYAQYEIIRDNLKPDDIFVHAPEHYAGALCGAIEKSPLINDETIGLVGDSPYIFRLTESNWDFISCLTVKNYSNIFSKFMQFNNGRTKLSEKSYSDICNVVNDREFGQTVTGEEIAAENGEDRSLSDKKSFSGWEVYWDYAIRFIHSTIPSGVKVFITFPPINKSNLMRTYSNDDEIKAAADGYTNYVKSMVGGLNITVLLGQNDTVYPGRHFSNHDYHLGAPMRYEHTRKIFTALIDELIDIKDDDYDG